MKKIIALMITLIMVFQMIPAVVLADASIAGGATVAAPSKVLYDEYADISITLGKTTFSAFGGERTFTAAPYIAGGVTSAQLDSILACLGYSVNYDPNTKVLTAADASHKIVITAGSKTYKLDGASQTLPAAPSAVSNTLMVPAAPVLRALGYTVAYDGIKRVIHITKYKDYSLDNYIIYNKDATTRKLVAIDKSGLTGSTYRNYTINAMYNINGATIAYVFDNDTQQNKLALYSKGAFTELRKGFDVTNTFEFGGNRVFLGTDTTDKKSKFYRFDGSSLILVLDDYSNCTMESSKEVILLNRLNLLIKIDKTWNTSVIDTDVTIKGNYVIDGVLYIKVKSTQAIKEYLLLYDGEKLVTPSLGAATMDSMTGLAAADIKVCNGVTYALMKGSDGYRALFYFMKGKPWRISGEPLKSNIVMMEYFNSLLYMTICDSKGAYRLYIYDPIIGYFYQVSGNDFDDWDVNFTSARVIGDTLLLFGSVSYDTRKTYQQIMYIHKGENWNYTSNIPSIKSTLTVGTKPYIVTDQLLYIADNLLLEKAAEGISITQQAAVGDSIIFLGTDTATGSTVIGSHNKSYYELLRGISVSLWEGSIDGRLYVSGTINDTRAFYRITGNKATTLKSNFEASKIVKTKKTGAYLVYGTEYDPKSPYNGSKVLYLYDSAKNTFSLIAAGITADNFFAY